MWARGMLGSLPALILLSATSTNAITLDCKDVLVKDQHFDLSELAGPHAVHLIEETPPSLSNTTFTIDICNPLKRTKGVPKDNECQTGTYACGIEYDYNLADNSSTIRRVIPIAGQYAGSHGRFLDPEWTRLKNSASHDDANKEGLRVELHGGKYPFEKPNGRQQKAIIEFQCDRNRTGLEGAEGDSRDKLEEEDVAGLLMRDETDDKKDDKEKPAEDASLQLISYKSEGEGDDEFDVLRLQWKTKYACEGMTEHKPSSGNKSSSHWGFFTWFLIIAFLLIATYLIMGSFLNRSKYGAEGFDSVPHADFWREFPYTVKDWGRSIVGMVQGHSSRGGYSAV
ncbi:hypothetical protein D6D01_04831 [Aureobasidium pullulans]|uniref:Autophagy-related protein 27 n=1 Tax=Aureobasidium pullulans TaxID=5580 RepID=A0A4S9LB30_AURPU|nr:hypothetical protein D6D01_04831 [Aureobasidium pullulans]